jgi:septal ring factor EnvC (AmiA/AmiB activator)
MKSTIDVVEAERILRYAASRARRFANACAGQEVHVTQAQTEAHELAQAIDAMLQERAAADAHTTELTEQLAAAEKERDSLRKALEHYADERNWNVTPLSSFPDRDFYVAGGDGFDVAREALEQRGKE